MALEGEHLKGMIDAIKVERETSLVGRHPESLCTNRQPRPSNTDAYNKIRA
ncbi:hypothetical protein [Pseudomonas viridiflava]|uniref:hypothetical protein n=1 Tax=Pseudomonas viridiflava TaxID=33069 RepID=UPI0013C35843|nr:hypothetical protein [Pseudomonas viridiflava]